MCGKDSVITLVDGGTAHGSLDAISIVGHSANTEGGAADSVLRAVSMYLPAYGETQDDWKTLAPLIKAIAGVGKNDSQRSHPKSEETRAQPSWQPRPAQ